MHVRCSMSPWNRSFCSALFTLALMTLARGECCLSNAYGIWPSSPTWDDPWTLEIQEINALVSVAALHRTREAHSLVVAGGARLGPTTPSVHTGTIGRSSRTGQALGALHVVLADGPAVAALVPRGP